MQKVTVDSGAPKQEASGITATSRFVLLQQNLDSVCFFVLSLSQMSAVSSATIETLDLVLLVGLPCMLSIMC